MQDPQTAADGDYEEDDTLSQGFSVGNVLGSIQANPNYESVYASAIDRLRAQREGLSPRQRLGALLVGFGQPTRHGKWQEALTNASGLVFQQSLAQRERDERRREQLARLEEARGIARENYASRERVAALRAQAIKDAAAARGAGGGRLNADQTKRLGIVKTLWPDLNDEAALKKLYDPKVEVFLMRPGIAAAAASQGVDVGEAIASAARAVDVPPAPAPVAAPTLGEFLPRARAANPKATDAELIEYYNQKYGGR